MTKGKSTKRALLASVFALVVCFAMLVGSTFAWFTDSASTAVNTIKSGTLKVDLVGADGKTLEGKTLDFVKAADAPADEEILWEPGCTYDLEPVTIVNKGNLALKYKIILTGINGDAKLNEAIDWTIRVGGADADLSTFEGTLIPGESESAALTISGHMKETAGNEYQGLTIDGVAITVVATQYTYEYDSIDDKYDENADYVATFTSGTHTINQDFAASKPDAFALKVSGADTNVTIEGGTVDGGSGGNNQAVHVREGANVTINDGTFTVGGDANDLGNSVIESNGGNITINGGFFYTDYQYAGKYYVLNQKNDNPGTITVTGGTFVNYNPAWGDDNLNKDRWGTDVIDGGFVAEGYAVSVDEQENGDVWYTVVKAATKTSELRAALREGEDVKLTKDINLRVALTAGKDTVIDLGGYTLSSDNNALAVSGGNVTVKNGTVKANSIAAGGAALYAYGDSNVTIENCTIENSRNQSYAVTTNGAESKNVTLVIKNSTIKAPTAAGAKGYAVYIPAGNVTLENCDVTGHVFIAGGNVTIDGGSYTATGFNNQAKIWNKADTASYMSGHSTGSGAVNMGDCILIADRRAGDYALNGLTIRNATFNSEITLKDGTAATVYAIKYVDMGGRSDRAPVNYVIENNTYNNLIDGADPVMFIDLAGNDIAK